MSCLPIGTTAIGSVLETPSLGSCVLGHASWSYFGVPANKCALGMRTLAKLAIWSISDRTGPILSIPAQNIFRSDEVRFKILPIPNTSPRSISSAMILVLSRASRIRSSEPVMDSCLRFQRPSGTSSEFLRHFSTQSIPVSMNRHLEKPSNNILEEVFGLITFFDLTIKVEKTDHT